MARTLRHLLAPIIDNNPVTLQVLGLCSALAVTTSLLTALTMSAALTAVLVMSNIAISAIRHHIPNSIRLIVQITIISTLVIVIDQFLQAFAFEISQRLSIFVSLIVTNCLVMGRAEAFAMRNPVGPSILDGLGNGLGYSLILVIIGIIRELFGAGTLLGLVILPAVKDGGWYTPLNLMLMAPSAFFILGLLVWAIRSLRVEQAEPKEFPLTDEPERRHG
ncbi:MAG: NADH:ubiquinone reductase (Na(+)-transporting) subunit D [Devosia sp.]|nr:NADH:ubiquinone reductase (Na(+)-transporting) subunit D [Devosia sp.]